MYYIKLMCCKKKQFLSEPTPWQVRSISKMRQEKNGGGGEEGGHTHVIHSQVLYIIPDSQSNGNCLSVAYAHSQPFVFLFSISCSFCWNWEHFLIDFLWALPRTVPPGESIWLDTPQYRPNPNPSESMVRHSLSSLHSGMQDSRKSTHHLVKKMVVKDKHSSQVLKCRHN